MISAILKSVLLLGLLFLYATNVSQSDNILHSILYDKVNFVVLLGILLLIGTFFRLVKLLFMLVLIGGIALYAYTYYEQSVSKTTNYEQRSSGRDDCGENASWYQKLSAHCNNPVK